MLISFEGIDGCGKTTQITLFKTYLEEKNISYSVFREPGGTKISEKVRNLLLYENEEMDSVTELLLFSAARSQLLAEKVIPLLGKGEVVILDRFFDSTSAYQGYGRQSADLESIDSLNRLAAHNWKPDLTFYLRIDLKEAKKRTENSEKDRMESAGDEFFRRVISGYDELAKHEKRIVPLNAQHSPQTIHRRIAELFEEYYS